MAATMLKLPYDEHRGALFGLCYRMTGSAADAEDLVQDTFRRALEHPPADQEAPLRPWLMKIATNLSIDALRKRKRERYFGPWLPAPVETERLRQDLDPSPEARYGNLESASVAFLLALEVLDERQRAVLVLRDVVGMTGPEAGEVLGLSSGNVRVILHRARHALAGYDEERRPLTPELRAKTADVLRRFLFALASGDIESTLELLSPEVVSVHDGGGEFTAAVRPVRGAAEVVELYENIRAHAPDAPRMAEERDYNGLPAIAVDFGPRPGRYASRMVMTVEIGPEGLVTAIRAVIASAKLHAVAFPGVPQP